VDPGTYKQDEHGRLIVAENGNGNCLQVVLVVVNPWTELGKLLEDMEMADVTFAWTDSSIPCTVLWAGLREQSGRGRHCV
jgi:hypothetical protein